MPLKFYAYNGKTDPKMWLINYHLTMKAASALDPHFMHDSISPDLPYGLG
jgi:hypothetical protein